MENKIKVLIVDKESDLVVNIESFLQKNNFYTESTIIPTEIIDKLENNYYDWLITGLDMPYYNGFELLLWVKVNYPKLKVIVISRFKNQELIEFANKHGAVKYFSKPFNLNDLKTLLLESKNKNGFEGDIYKTNIFSLLHSVILSNKNLLISITCSSSFVSGLIYIKNNKIIHSSFGTLFGKEAFDKMLFLKKGKVSILPWFEPPIITLDISNNILNEIEEKHHNRVLNKSIEILVVDKDKKTSLLIEKFLSNRGYKVFSTISGLTAAKKLKENTFDFIIADLNLEQISGIDLLIWINENSPQTQVILTSKITDDDELKFFSEEKGAIKYLHKPIDLFSLDLFIQDEINNNGLFGSVSYLELIDIIKISVFSKEKYLITVEDYLTLQTGLIYIDNGNIIHAQYENLVGETAFYSLISLNRGVFFYVPWQEPNKTTINKTVWELLLNYNKGVTKSKYDIKQLSKEIPNNLKEIFSQNKDNTISGEKFLIKYTSRVLEQTKDLIKYENEEEFLNKFIIYESGIALGIIIGKTHKKEVLNIMKSFSNIDYSNNDTNLFFYEDLSILIIFNFENLVEEIRFFSGYKGILSKGIKIGDHIQKAIDTYGKPKVCTLKGCIWDYFSVYSEKGYIISSIRLRNTIPFNKFDKEFLESLRKNKRLLIEPNNDLKEINSPNEYKVVKNKIDLTINENDSSVFGIHLHKSNIKEVFAIMENISDERPVLEKDLLVYKDIGAIFYFDKEKKLVKDITLCPPFRGHTIKGLEIFDRIEKAKELYGEPIVSTNNSAIWSNIAVFLDEEIIINSIRLV